MEHELRNRLVEMAELVTAMTGLSEQAIGQRAINDNTFFRRIREKEANFTVRTYDRLMDWMKAEAVRAKQDRAA